MSNVEEGRAAGGGARRMERTRVLLSRAMRDRGPGGASGLRTALRAYVCAAREAGLGVGWVLAEVDVLWKSVGGAARQAVTRDVLEVATLLELGAGSDDVSQPEASPG